MVVRRTGKQPLYAQIADQLRDAIHRGDLAPGEQLPTEQQLIERFSVSRNTVRLALGVLNSEGLISSSQGRGSFVRERTPLHYFASRTDSRSRREQLTKDAFLSDAEEQGRSGRIDLDVAIVRALPEFATRLQSAMVTVWVKTTGGRIKSDVRIAPDMAYHSFPWPDAQRNREAIVAAAHAVLDVRARHGSTPLATLYDHISMPPALADAHDSLDVAVDRAYDARTRFDTDAKRLSVLFNRFADLSAASA